MKHLLIVYHSQSGRTRDLAMAVSSGAATDNNVDLRLIRAMEACIDDLLWADGVIFGTPENFGYMSGGLKDFFDRTFYPAVPHALNLPFGLFISAGNDGTGAQRQIERVLKGYPMRAVIAPVIVKGDVDNAAIVACEELGATLAAGLSLGIF